jgi:hypothetical protein
MALRDWQTGWQGSLGWKAASPDALNEKVSMVTVRLSPIQAMSAQQRRLTVVQIVNDTQGAMTCAIMMNGSAIRTGACLDWDENPRTSPLALRDGP